MRARLTTANVSARVSAKGRNSDDSLKLDVASGEAGSGRDTAQSGDEGCEKQYNQVLLGEKYSLEGCCANSITKKAPDKSRK